MKLKSKRLQRNRETCFFYHKQKRIMGHNLFRGEDKHVYIRYVKKNGSFINV